MLVSEDTLSILALQETVSQENESKLKEAIQLREAGRYDKAQEWLLKFINDKNENPEALSMLSQIFLLKNDLSKAEFFLGKAKEIDPKLPSVFQNEAKLQLKQAKVKDALKTAQCGYEQHSDSLESLLVLATCLSANQKLKEAEVYLEKIISIRQNYAEAFANRSIVRTKLKNIKGAIKDAEQAVLLKPHLTQIWELLGSLFQQLGDLKNAARALKHAHENEPSNIKYISQLANLLLSENRKGEALTLLEGAAKIAPRNANIWCGIGIALQQDNKVSQAKEAFEKALDIDPELIEVLGNLGAIESSAGNLDKSLEYNNRVLELNPNSFEAHNNVGITLRKLGHLREAEVSVKRAIELNPNFANAHANLGNVLKETGRFNEAEASYRTAIKLQPSLSEAHNNLGTILDTKSRFEEASISYQRAVEIAPNFAEAHLNLGNVQQKMGQVNKAEASYKAAINAKPTLSTAHKSLGVMLREEGRIHEAVSSLQKAFATESNINLEKNDELAPAITGLLFELTNKCNFHCVFCPSDFQKRDLGSMDIELVKRLYKETADKKIATSVSLHLMGEPTLHPKLIEILEYGAEQKVKTVLVTNGSTLVRKIVPKILGSLYGQIVASHMTVTKESYHLRGKVGLSWERYIGNLRLLVSEYMKFLANGEAIKNDLVIRVMVTQDTASNASVIENESEARSILEEWSNYVAKLEKELGVKPFKRINSNSKNLLRGNNPTHTDYPLQEGITLQFWKAFTFANTCVSDDFELKENEKAAYCPHPFTDVGVLWNGDVTLCSLDHDGELKVGNIHKSSISEVIQSEKARDLRASMLGKRPLPSLCKTCQSKPVRRENS